MTTKTGWDASGMCRITQYDMEGNMLWSMAGTDLTFKQWAGCLDGAVGVALEAVIAVVGVGVSLLFLWAGYKVVRQIVRSLPI